MTSTAASLVRATFRLDRSKLARAEALRGAIGVALPLLIGIAVGRPLDGAIAAGGAFAAGFAALSSGYRVRATAAALAAAGLAVSTFVGAAVADSLPILALTLALWGFAAGMLVSLGVAATIVGLQAVIGLLLITPYPMSVLDASGRAGLVAAGGLGQVLLVVTLWPLRRATVERRALAAAYASLSAYATRLAAGSAGTTLPEVRLIEVARESLTDPQPFARADTQLAFVALLEQAERLRTTLAAMAQVRPRLAGVPARAAAVQAADEVVVVAGQVLDELATGIGLSGIAARRAALAAAGPASAPMRWSRLQAAIASLGQEEIVAGPARAHAGASLVGELRRLSVDLIASLEAVVQGARGALEQNEGIARRTPSPFGRSAATTLRANLTLRSVAFRHAVRLGGTLAVGVLAAGLLPAQHRYWLPLTALVVLKPDFTSTFTRGFGRIAGTVLGAGVATALLAGFGPPPVVLAVLVTLTAFAGYAVLFANYAAYGLAVTCFVVFLLAFTGLPGAGTVTDRIEATVLGGVLALAAYLVWPTWERVRLPEALARLVEAQRAWGGALLRAYGTAEQAGGQASERSTATPAATRAALPAQRAAARLARVNAEASLERARLEPSRRGLDPGRAGDVLAAARRFALSGLALQAHLADADVRLPPPQLAAVARLAADLEGVLDELATALRAGRRPVALPSLRAVQLDLHRQLQLLSAASVDPTSQPAATADTTQLSVAVLDVETEVLVTSALQILEVLAQPAPAQLTGRARFRR